MKKIAEKLGPGNWGTLARKSGYDRTHVRRVLSGKRSCTLDFACVICDMAGLTLNDLRSYLVSRKLSGDEAETAFRRALMGLPMGDM